MTEIEQELDVSGIKRTVFFVRPVTSFNNLGDLLICRALVQNLSVYGVVYVDQKCCPKSFIEVLTVGLENVYQTPRFYQRICAERFAGKRVSLVTIPGHFFGGGFQKCMSTLVAGVMLAMMRIAGVRIYKFGGCLGPLSRSVAFAERVRRFWFSYYGLRDSESICCIGNTRNTHLFPDFAFLSNELALSPSEQILSNYCVVSFRAETNSELRTDSYRESIKQRLCEIIGHLPKDLRFIFSYQVPSDSAFVGELYRAVIELGRECEVRDAILSLPEAIDLYRNARCVFSNRLHVLLPCIALGVRHLAILDVMRHHKISAIYRDNGLEKLLCDINSDRWDMETFWEMNSSYLRSVANNNRRKGHEILAELFG